jgi:AAA+ ATPase superfamily predicted ATPase
MSVRQHFVGRKRELAALEAGFSAESGQLYLVSGRRRIGKSYLLQRFVRRRRAIFYQATRQAEAQELAAFTREARTILGGLPDGYAFPNGETALEHLDAASGA